MTKGESAVAYLTKFTQIRDELAAVEETVVKTELVRTALNGFTKQWDVFVRGVVAMEKLPDWERLWDDFTQEELQVDANKNEGNRIDNFDNQKTSSVIIAEKWTRRKKNCRKSLYDEKNNQGPKK
jgi:hypothetical protein